MSRKKQADKIAEEIQSDNPNCIIIVRTDKTKFEKHLKNALQKWNRKGSLFFCDLLSSQYSEQEFQEKVDFFNRFYKKRNLLFKGTYHSTTDKIYSIVEVKKISYN